MRTLSNLALSKLSDPNVQTAAKELLVYAGVNNPGQIIKKALDFSDQFEILEYDDLFGYPKSIRKKSTNEVFSTGDMVWHEKYQKEIGPIYFDGAFLGEMISKTFYVNRIRANSGLYNLDDIAAINKYKYDIIL